MKRIVYLSTIIIASFMASCEDVTEVFNPQSDVLYKQNQFSTLAGQFEYIWNGLNNSYVFWYADTTDWDEVHDVYLPKFKELDYQANLGQEIDDEIIDSLITEVASSLIDRHLEIYMSNPYKEKPSKITASRGLNSILEREGAWSLLFGDKYCKTNLFNNYKTSNEREFSLDDGEYSQNAYSCVISDSIPILHLFNYYITAHNFCEAYPEFLDVANNFFDNIRSLSAQNKLKGIIIDNRFNFGGLITDEELLVQSFSKNTLETARSRSKYGLGKYDYAPWVSYKIQPNEEKYIEINNTPIVILQNLYSASAGESVGHALSLLPNTYIIGERSYGAFSPLFVGEVEDFVRRPNTGSFNADSVDFYLSNNKAVAAVETASFCFELKNKRSGKFEQLEGIGIEPDEHVELDLVNFVLGKGDAQLDAAIKYIREQ